MSAIVDIENVEALARVRGLCATGAARAVRQANRLSLGDVAAVVRVGRSTVFRWEVGERAPRGEPARRYLELLDRLMRSGGPR